MNTVLQNDFSEIIDLIPALMTFRGRRWLLTGATGMIGSYILSFLSYLNERKLDESMHITVVHRSEINRNHLNLGYLLDKEYISFKRLDLSANFIIEDMESYDFVIHGASNAAPKLYLNDPIGTINTNVRATQILLEALRESHMLKTFVYISSGEIYGNPDSNNIPTSEDYIGKSNHLSPRSCYVEAKKFAEVLCWNYYSAYNMPIRIIRPVHVFGPGFNKNDGRVWADFISKAVCGEKIEILGDGLSRRSFCYLADALVQIFGVLLRGINGEVYNVGNEQHISIKELADIVAACSEKKAEVIVKNQLPPYLQGSPHISCPCIDKVKGLVPVLRTDIECGIAKTIAWFSSMNGQDL